ncbi:hypothetical protein CHS0354_021647 [Potamilus streckersoni]|uniref:Uncharacterized protein n=1 Tax=Potamilus streckersoni TaxID=2493646 RepID=A0AAE0SPC4_9BIVA|nr:hypothetical protein CHS0354_021647 [Potamilus streckersoni]
MDTQSEMEYKYVLKTFKSGSTMGAVLPSQLKASERVIGNTNLLQIREDELPILDLLGQIPTLKRIVCEEKYQFTPDDCKTVTRE